MEKALMVRAACTIVSLNYLAYAKTLCDSFLHFHPDCKFYVLLVDRLPTQFNLSSERFELIPVEDLAIPDFESVAFKYDILELNTNVKPAFLKYLLARGIEQLIYFDPDIRLFQGVELIFDLLHEHSILLTPHCVSPTPDEDRELEQSFLSLGVFNLGFVAVNSSAESLAFLDWWSERCLSLGFCEARTGLFVDQKWANLVPCLFDHVYILKHKGFNVAYWNLFERKISASESGKFFVNGNDPLVFFHFSGVDWEASDIVSRKAAAHVTLTCRPDLKPLIDLYKGELLANQQPGTGNAKYSFGEFSNGVQISTLARRVYASIQQREHVEGNPFDSSGPFYQFARKHRLIGQSDSSQKYDSRHYPKSDRRLRFIHGTFKALLRLLGNDRYSLLLKYLSHFSVLRNQDVLFQESLNSAQSQSKDGRSL
jgi:hypothetical protein